jgi:hypothetical protein
MKVWFCDKLLVVLKAPVSLVTVCGASLAFVQITWVPFLIVRVEGSNEYIPFFSTICTLATVEGEDEVGLG